MASEMRRMASVPVEPDRTPFARNKATRSAATAAPKTKDSMKSPWDRSGNIESAYKEGCAGQSPQKAAARGFLDVLPLGVPANPEHTGAGMDADGHRAPAGTQGRG